MKKFTLNKLAAGLALSIAGVGFMLPSAQAATVTSTFNATATVNASCRILSTSDVAFGAFTPAVAGTLTANGNVQSRCTRTTAYAVSLDAGSTVGGTYAMRLMTPATGGNTDFLQYNLYTTAGLATVFGDGTAGTGTISGTGTGAAVNTVVYGSLSLNQFIQPDSYSDVITATVTF